jgi:hypothetical protein
MTGKRLKRQERGAMEGRGGEAGKKKRFANSQADFLRRHLRKNHIFSWASNLEHQESIFLVWH